jgi:His/Glu/Gln/Arg/opine family amino acid ABC transporter permease subunit
MYTLRWEVLLPYVPRLAWGLALSLTITGASLLLGSILGLLLAFARTSSNVALRRSASAYVELLRNVPLLLIIIFIYFGLPLMGIRFLDNVPSVIVAMSLYAAAYLCEIFRAGILSVEKGYIEAGKSIGLTSLGVARHVTIPLMFAQALPAIGNMTISLFKDSSLASAASVAEVTLVGRVINTDTWRIVEVWTVVGGIYLGISYILAFLLRRIEVPFVRWR